MDKITKFEYLFLPFAILLALGLSLFRFNSIPVGIFFDDAHYLILSESLANGSGYRLINFPAMPIEQAFPPGWPLLLTPVAKLWPGNLIIPKFVTLGFALCSIWLANVLFKKRLSKEGHFW
ncbi:MAG: hypothetical protein AAGD96_18090, partial [Chloroflexota bacterium]